MTSHVLCVVIHYARTIVLTDIHKYINKHFVLLLRYAKENSRKRIKCTVSPKSNRCREGTQTGTENRGRKEDIERTRIRIRTCQGNLLQGERCKENLEKSGIIMSLPSFFSNYYLLLILQSLDDICFQINTTILIPNFGRVLS